MIIGKVTSLRQNLLRAVTLYNRYGSKRTILQLGYYFSQLALRSKLVIMDPYYALFTTMAIVLFCTSVIGNHYFFIEKYDDLQFY